ncbi:MAG: hypothetical protein ABI353_20690 [Isosphaeraceae bacterium]
MMDRPLDDRSKELQAEIDRLSEELGVRSMPVGMRTNDGLNSFVADDGSYHFTFITAFTGLSCLQGNVASPTAVS